MGLCCSRHPATPQNPDQPVQTEVAGGSKGQGDAEGESPGPVSSAEEESGAEEDDQGMVVYDLRLLRENIEIIRHYLYWSGRVLVDLRPYYPKWVYHLGKPWRGLIHDEAFLFLYSLALSVQFFSIVLGFAMKYAIRNSFLAYTTAQFVVDVLMFSMTLLLFFYPRFKCYIFIYFWVIAKGLYWASYLYSVVVFIDPYFNTIQVVIRLGVDMYVTIAILMHSLIDYARLDYTHEVLQEILKEEMEITREMVQRNKDTEFLFNAF